MPAIVAQLLWLVACLIGLAYALPVVLNLQSPMGLIIVALGLYEAWSINRRVPVVIGGPYQIARAGAGSVADVEPVG